MCFNLVLKFLFLPVTGGQLGEGVVAMELFHFEANRDPIVQLQLSLGDAGGVSCVSCGCIDPFLQETVPLRSDRTVRLHKHTHTHTYMDCDTHGMHAYEIIKSQSEKKDTK